MKSFKIFHKKKLLAKGKVHNTILSCFLGLRFASPLKKNEGILLASKKENLGAIDMLFVFFPIDIIWLSKSFKIIHIARNVRPFTPFVQPPQPAQYILELPRNGAKNLSVGNKLSKK